ncbi:MAG: TonB-dependent receptor plug domain-containing protein [Cellulophaga sp.]|nr:TonB-dependent receptor plug domain-containing protein [Cellulophaga sp.]
MKLSHFFSLAVLLFSCFLSNGQEASLIDNITGKLIRYTGINSPEKTYIHSDKDHYVNGETIWYKAYLVDGITHSISEKSKVLYIELLSATDSIIVQQKLFIDTFGAAGNIDLPETIEEGNYTLRAYTQYMFNEKEPVVFSKQISVWKSKNLNKNETVIINSSPDITNLKEDIQPIINFFPEGGSLVYGIKTNIGIKITDKEGNELLVSGKIVDQNNTLIQSFETFEYGLGRFTYVPEMENTYYATVLINGEESKFPLPQPEKEGYVLNLIHTTDQVTARVATTIENGLQGTVLIGHVRGRIFVKHTNESNTANYSVKFPTKSLEDGVAHFTLFTALGEPVCERLVFIDNPNNDHILNVETLVPSYKKRQKINLALTLESLQEKPSVGSFSATIYNSLGKKTILNESIESWLLLNSDVGGTIHNASFFFQENTTKSKYLLDVLMMTHGWRRFVWKTMLNERVSKTKFFEAEKGIEIKGRTTDFKNKYLSKPSFISLSVLGNQVYSEKKATDSNGNFSFGPYFFQDSIQAIFQSEPMTVSNRSSQNEFAIQINEFSPRANTIIPKNTIKYEYPKEYVTLASEQKIVDFKLDPSAINLKEVIVVQKKKTPRELLEEKIKEVTLHGQPNNRIFPDSIMGLGSLTIFDLLRNIAGLQVTGSRGFESVRIRAGNGAPVFLLDGMPTDIDFINIINPVDVEFIDVLKDANAAVYSNSSNGVIAIYTKGTLGLQNNQKISPNITHVTINGFYKDRAFFSPNYNNPKEADNEKDLRTTLHWQPNIIITEKESTTINFFTGDVPGRYIIHIEGITIDGVPISTFKTFVVE